MLDRLTDALLGSDALLLTVAGGAIVALILLIVVLRKVREIRAGKIADRLTGPVMFAGMLWSADAVWVLTGPEYLGLPTPLRIAMFAVLEFMLLVAMLRAKDSVDRVGHTGRHGTSVWLIASLIALFGFILGMFEGGLVVAVFRPIVPLMLTKLWSDGVLGDGARKVGSFKWTPRKLLILMGAIDGDDRDVQTVNRDRLIDQMVTLHRKWSTAKDEDRKSRLEGKLVHLSEKADPQIIGEVRRRRELSNWFTVTQIKTRSMPDGVTHLVTQSGAPGDAVGDADVAITPTRRSKSVTQHPTGHDAHGADPATRAAQLVMTQNLGIREAARQIPGAAEATVRRRVEKLRDAADDAPNDAPVTHPPTNGYPVLTGPTE